MTLSVPAGPSLNCHACPTWARIYTELPRQLFTTLCPGVCSSHGQEQQLVLALRWQISSTAGPMVRVLTGASAHEVVVKLALCTGGIRLDEGWPQGGCDEDAAVPGAAVAAHPDSGPLGGAASAWRCGQQHALSDALGRSPGCH